MAGRWHTCRSLVVSKLGECQEDHVTHKFDRHLSSSAAEVPVKLTSDQTTLGLYLEAWNIKRHDGKTPFWLVTGVPHILPCFEVKNTPWPDPPQSQVVLLLSLQPEDMVCGTRYTQISIDHFPMMMSQHGNKFCIDGPLRVECTSNRWSSFPYKKARNTDVCCFFDVSLNKLLNKHLSCWWSEMSGSSHHVTEMIFTDMLNGCHSLYPLQQIYGWLYYNHPFCSLVRRSVFKFTDHDFWITRQ